MLVEFVEEAFESVERGQPFVPDLEVCAQQRDARRGLLGFAQKRLQLLDEIRNAGGMTPDATVPDLGDFVGQGLGRRAELQLGRHRIESLQKVLSQEGRVRHGKFGLPRPKVRESRLERCDCSVHDPVEVRGGRS